MYEKYHHTEICRKSNKGLKSFSVTKNPFHAEIKLEMERKEAFVQNIERKRRLANSEQWRLEWPANHFETI